MSDVRLTDEEREELGEALAPDLYLSVMEATADHWRQWRFLTDFAKETHRAEAGRIIADAVAPAVERIIAARLAPIEALADEWERTNFATIWRGAAQLRAALTAAPDALRETP